MRYGRPGHIYAICIFVNLCTRHETCGSAHQCKLHRHKTSSICIRKRARLIVSRIPESSRLAGYGDEIECRFDVEDKAKTCRREIATNRTLEAIFFYKPSNSIEKPQYKNITIKLKSFF